ncbi:hypothetical protein B0H16DRAFT_723579 [Mycena metata]|uniref:Uncharacterized protein n=1 Tax=Mycena metata TaxID=1033252 RepID=A0AAD7K6W7_9AGAR|nr:hypothetical protein B0H16DRAFT_723579 [Mycena metata]
MLSSRIFTSSYTFVDLVWRTPPIPADLLRSSLASTRGATYVCHTHCSTDVHTITAALALLCDRTTVSSMLQAVYETEGRPHRCCYGTRNCLRFYLMAARKLFIPVARFFHVCLQIETLFYSSTAIQTPGWSRYKTFSNHVKRYCGRAMITLQRSSTQSFKVPSSSLQDRVLKPSSNPRRALPQTARYLATTSILTPSSCFPGAASSSTSD